MRIDQAMGRARSLGVDRLDAQLILGHLLGQPRAWLLAHDDHHLDPAQTAALEQALTRRAAGEPLAYVLGEWNFCGLMLQVSPDVLVPRPETEVLVDWATECIARHLTDQPASGADATCEVVDLGTGSGAIALALARRCPSARLVATDRSAAALAVAAANGRRLALPLTFLQGDWWAPVQGRRFDLAVSNPPYVAGSDTHLAALQHEPREALTPEGDGLSALRQIVQDAHSHLLPGAWLLLEHGHDQGSAVADMLAAAGFETCTMRQDLAGLPRCTGGRRPRVN